MTLMESQDVSDEMCADLNRSLEEFYLMIRIVFSFQFSVFSFQFSVFSFHSEDLPTTIK